MKRTTFKAVSLTLALALLAGCAPAAPKDQGGAAAKVEYPKGAVSVVVPYAAGGGTDLVTRAIVDAAKEDFSKGISVENRTGGGGAVGMVYGANAKADGSVVTTVCVELTTLPHTGTGGNLDASQFTPIMMMNAAYSTVTVRADAPWNTLEEFLEAAKTKKLQIGNSGVGAIWHLGAAALAKEAGVTFAHVPFDGAAPAITSLLGGHIDAVSVSYPEVSAQVKAGELKVLAILSEERLESVPEVPTAKELGFNAVVGTWRGLAVPKATPKEISDEIYNIFNKASQSEGFKEFMANNNLDINVLNGEEFAERIASDNELFKVLIEDLGLSK